MAETRQRAVRRDGLENRERILAAATTVVAREGVHVPLAKVASAAGVGVGTLYRHFPDRAALFDGLAVRSLGLVLDAVRTAAGDPGTAADGLRAFFTRTVEHREQLILPLHGAPESAAPEAVALRGQVRETIGTLLERGRADGTVGPGVTSGDIVLMGAMLAQPLPQVTDWDRAARRLIGIYLAGLAGPGAGMPDVC